MTNRLVTVLVLIPIAIVLIALSVANRGPVIFTVDPFNPGNPALSYSAPLFVWLFLALILGLLIGSFATWYKQGRHRKQARENRDEAARLRTQADQMQKAARAGLGPALPSPR
ncbi:MAG: lipopolysaccharide assembly protein LapA domain-containing protein [Phyllobacterium sp.]